MYIMSYFPNFMLIKHCKFLKLVLFYSIGNSTTLDTARVCIFLSDV